MGHVVFLGHRDDIELMLRKVDVVVLPTYYGEGVPRILIEAAAAGLPLVASDMPGCREIVKHGFNGFLVPPKNPQQLARAIRDLFIDDDLRARMGKHSRELACGNFSQIQVIEQTLRVYDKALRAGFVTQTVSVGAEN
jgi:glycosyltransferase involved in cell wall biosynthesis